MNQIAMSLSIVFVDRYENPEAGKNRGLPFG
jgi:hypothetical protein